MATTKATTHTTKATKATKATKGNAPVAQSAVPVAPVTPAKAAPTPKCAQQFNHLGKLQRRMFTTITWISPKGAVKGLRPKRWDNYAVGQTLHHCRVTNGLDHLDVQFYVTNGLMRVAPCTDKQWDAIVAAHVAGQPLPMAIAA